VSTERLGPRKSKACDNRFDNITIVELVAVLDEMWSRLIVPKRSSRLSRLNPPTNTPTRCPANAVQSRPASSKASQVASSNNRCCGSSTAASRAERPRNLASNSYGD